ncbi:hypothetical protein GCM10010873_16530 [Cypionkella aquatica]|uniref:Uncharacterized protein n=1 Tax=Cypionkella aquatica TaxID=1756042 RepID=A0AA37U389_9RHOB|nr:hypothetical protein [Cypionkella aquatica]GLS86679.1 hypothetical protein GCM10010873_16530 [Cypionkella aquatica]
MLNILYQRLLDSGKFVSVGISEDIEAIAGRATAADDGALFVVPYRERAMAARYATGGHRQKVDAQFLVAMVFRQHDDPRGTERALRFDALKNDVEQTLAGWSPAEGGDPCSLTSGEGSGLPNGVSLYIQTWQTSRYLIGAQP